MHFDEVGLDVLKEIGNIGSSKAATALSQMLDTQIGMKVPSCEMVPFNQIADIFSGPEAIVSAVLVQMSGDMEGFVMLIQELDDACSLVGRLMGQQIPPSNDMGELQTVLKPMEEIANILIGSYLQAISEMTGFSVIPSVPELNIDMALAIMNVPALVYGEIGEEVLLMETEFDGGQMAGHFLLIPTVESYNQLMKALNIV